PRLSPTFKSDSMKEWAHPARPTAFTVPIPSKHAAFTLQRCNAEAEANTVFVDPHDDCLQT
ncbi:hypothetical protein C8R44DRAFT_809503, partial [Mycena epipterygia]